MLLERRINQILLMSFIGLSFFAGLFDFYFRNNQSLYGTYNIVISLLTIAIIFIWYIKDSDNISYKRTAILNIMVLALTIFSLPYYFYKSRGLKIGSLYMFVFLLLNVMYLMSAVLGVYVGDTYVQ